MSDIPQARKRMLEMKKFVAEFTTWHNNEVDEINRLMWRENDPKPTPEVVLVVKKKRASPTPITEEERATVLAFAAANPTFLQSQLAEHFGKHSSRISDIINNRRRSQRQKKAVMGP